MLTLYGHPFSAYTWKVQIALHENVVDYEFRILDAEHPAHAAFVAATSPTARFPVLQDGDTRVFEATAILEYLQAYHPGPVPLLPADPRQAWRVRMYDRIYDNYLMTPLQIVVYDALRPPEDRDPLAVAEARETLEKTYRWLQAHLVDSSFNGGEAPDMADCAAAPALFYADWVQPIPETLQRVRAHRERLLGRDSVARCVEAARPYRAGFPLGAPDRD